MLRGLDLPPVWGALFAALIWLWAENVTIAPLPATPALWGGRALIALALGLALWAAWFFLKRRTPIEPRQTPRALLTEGPFAFTRNPIYRSLVMILAGWALICGETTAFIFPAAYALLLLKRFAIPEEAILLETFGSEWRDYAARVRRRL
ncbi:methyltransferase family protein [Rubrimonas cliftonensis]|uniref:Phospholipid methyltransferase n=1 Tax=Rubrimonas cliftonensis TaxID=89524 RepID=A0A1H3VTS2_9RHOB|nr:methyltransferase [Rubrimonas cliftonensis]SDZ78176.1 Phospholipid methyltransferase [Rubrimonas cliftonensis]